uniref:Uncharacterized protein n=1 Tax=Arundo donax TaxID=35708 RepID=A0A0A9DJG7_ARUDO
MTPPCAPRSRRRSPACSAGATRGRCASSRTPSRGTGRGPRRSSSARTAPCTPAPPPSSTTPPPARDTTGRRSRRPAAPSSSRRTRSSWPISTPC